MTLTRRHALIRGGALLAAAWAAPRLARAAASPAVAALDDSQLIYLTPILPDGSESTCHGEVWFVHHGGEIYVNTQAGAWRAEALRRGYERAKIWIGEFGVWKRAEGRYRSAPYLEIAGTIEKDPAVHAELFPLFGAKYAAEWDSWGPRFRNGLADGSRVLLRYRIVS